MVDAHDFGADDLAGLHVLALEALCEKVGEAFAAGGGSGNGRHGVEIHWAEMAVKNTPQRIARHSGVKIPACRFALRGVPWTG
ncbi:hypothetical protein G6F50_018079 [Rhizopus delemar]|uniref:Uncharacterized protein n=1 Tax=Rhizopus delemar TaxID=936053 RepID=A0A9P6XNT7_9FUNG|nr:hypothetical protein G6F50_018079 [Rhizopus delemar]